MTTIEMQARVMAQLRSYPPGQEHTAAEIAVGMDGKLTAHDIEPTLRLFECSSPQLAVRAFKSGKGPDRWRLA